MVYNYENGEGLCTNGAGREWEERREYMENSNRPEPRSVHSNMAREFLESVRRRFANEKQLEHFDKCLSEYQDALIDLLLSEVLSEANGIPDASCLPSERVQQVIEYSQLFEHYQRALVTYLDERRRLKMAISQLHSLLQSNVSDSVGD
jgi:hypothetical protein